MKRILKIGAFLKIRVIRLIRLISRILFPLKNVPPKYRRYVNAGAYILILIMIPVSLYILKHAGEASAAWFDSNWSFRQRVDITNSGSAQTDYLTRFTLNTSALVTATKMQSDCDDIRVTDINGKLLPYWIETGTNACNTTTTGVWTKAPSVPASGATLYVYYGNPQATVKSDISWMSTGGTITLSGGYRIHTFTASGTFTTTVNTHTDALVVAGGGGGAGALGGGGGGAGGYQYQTSLAVTAQAYTVTVGTGGSGTNSDSSNGGNGNPSSFSTITGNGGGGGGKWASAGQNGGSGGGSGRDANGAAGGTGSQGNIN